MLRILRDEQGQSLIEYVLIGALVAIGVAAALIATSGAIRDKLYYIVSCLNSAGTSGAAC